MAERQGYRFEYLLPYYSGAFNAAVIIKGRLAAAGYVDAARDLAAYQEMLQEFMAAIRETYTLRRARESPKAG